MVHWMFSFSRALLIHRVRLAKALLLEVLPYDNKFCYVSPQLQLPEALSEYWSASPRNPPSCKKLQLPAWKCTSHYHSGTNFSDQENAEADIEPSTASKKTTWWDTREPLSFPKQNAADIDTDTDIDTSFGSCWNEFMHYIVGDWWMDWFLNWRIWPRIGDKGWDKDGK